MKTLTPLVALCVLMIRRNRERTVIAILWVLILFASVVLANAQDNFYQGKTITVVAGPTPAAPTISTSGS